MNKKLFIIFILTSFFYTGCLTFHKISYEINLETDLKGKGVITVYDIRSDAETDNEFEEDKNTIFDYMLKSSQFIKDMSDEGKDITSRRLFIVDELLNAEVKFNFNDIRQVEGIAFEDGFYFITMDLEDEILSTNGEIVITEDVKRIIWDKNVKTLIFEMGAADYNQNFYKELAPYYSGEVE